MKTYVDAEKLQEYTTKLVAKLKTLFPTSPLVASTAAGMTDTSRIYVYTGSETGYTAGDWYYYDPTDEEWKDGGIYQSSGIETDTTLAVAGMAADAKATGDAIAAAKSAVLAEIAPAYSSSATYAVGDYVIYNLGLYRCTTAITTAEAWTSGHWTQVDLAADVADLKNAFEKTGLAELTHSPYVTQGYIDNTGKWANRTSGNARCAIIPVKSGQTIAMTAGTTTTQIAALKSFNNPADSTSADFSAQTDWTALVQVTTGNDFSGVIPSDANYLYVWLGNYSAFARKPAKLSIDNYDYIANTVNNIQDKASKNSPAFTGNPTAPTPANNVDNTQIATTEYVKNIAPILSQYVDTLADGTNVDTLLTPGNYRVISAAKAATMTGTPPTKDAAYKLIVIETSQSSRTYQIAFVNSRLVPITYRYYTGTAWTEWRQLTANFTSFAKSKNLMPTARKTNPILEVNTIYADGLLTLNGTATNSGGKSAPQTENFVLPAGTYTMSLTYVDIKAVSTFLRDSDNNDIVNVKNILEPQTFTLAQDTECYVSINVTGSLTYTQNHIKIQIESGDKQTYFVPPSQGTAIDHTARRKKDGILSAFTNIECAGDSLTYGAVYTDNSNYRQAYKPYPTVLGHITGATVTTLATAGYNATQWWTNYSSQISAKTNALAIIFLGTNGGLTDTMDTDVSGSDPTNWANTYTGNYARIVNAYKTAGYKVLLLKCFNTSGDLAATNSVIEQMATKFDCGIIENEYMDDIAYHYTPDRVYANTLHYNDLGYSAMAHHICEEADEMPEANKAFLIPT